MANIMHVYNFYIIKINIQMYVSLCLKGASDNELTMSLGRLFQT